MKKKQIYFFFHPLKMSSAKAEDSVSFPEQIANLENELAWIRRQIEFDSSAAEKMFLSFANAREAAVDDDIQFWWKIMCHPQTRLDANSRALVFAEPCIPFGCTKQMTHIFVRPSYVNLEVYAHQAFHQNFGLLITGNPGIGKSIFAHYFIYRVIQHDTTWESIIFEHKSRLNRALHIRRKPGEPASHAELFFDNIQTCCATDKRYNYYIFDAAGPTSQPSKRVAKSLVLASPNLQCYKYWEKDAADRRYMPTWTWDEILHLWQLTYSNMVELACLETRYVQIGGIPRYLFHPHFEEIILNKLLYAVEKLNMNALIQCAGTFDAMHDVFSHMIFHYRLNKNYRMVEFVPGTVYIQELLWKKFEKHLSRHYAFIKCISTTTTTVSFMIHVNQSN